MQSKRKLYSYEHFPCTLFNIHEILTNTQAREQLPAGNGGCRMSNGKNAPMDNNDTGTRPDRRVRKTKALLQQGLIRLMREKDVKDISVKELSDLADINRGTFYLHYSDIYDMLAQLEDQLFQEFHAILDRTLNPESGVLSHGTAIREIFSFLERHKDLAQDEQPWRSGLREPYEKSGERPHLRHTGLNSGSPQLSLHRIVYGIWLYRRHRGMAELSLPALPRRNGNHLQQNWCGGNWREK